MPLHKLLKSALLTALVGFSILTSFAQKPYVMDSNPTLAISGTSSLHDWEMKSSQGTGQALISQKEGSLVHIENLRFEMPAESLKSGKNAMDRNAYAALKTKKHPEIKFTASSLEVKGDSLRAKGQFTVAGVTKTVEFPAQVAIKNDTYTFSGTYPFNLTDFEIDPPTAVFGTIKTGDPVKVSFEATFVPQE